MRMHVILVALTIGAAGQAHAQEAQSDPFEKFNRAVFSFNTVVDRYTLEPLAKGYRAITNEPIREGVGNVLSNLSAPVTFANDVLQAAPKRAGTTVAQAITAINTGLGGSGTASFVGGVLSIKAAASTNGVVVAQGSPAPSSRASIGFSQYFGLNDIVRSSDAPLVPSGFVASDPHGFAAGQSTEMVLRDGSGRTLASASLTGSVGPTFGDLVTELNASPIGSFGAFALDDRGRIQFHANGNVPDAAIGVTSDTTDRLGTGRSFSSIAQMTGDSSGLATATVRTDILSSPGKLGLAQLQTGATVGTKALGVGDNRGTTEFVKRIAATVDLGKDGVTTTTTLTAQILGNTGARAAQVAASLADATARRDDAVNRRDSFSGVNIDEELSQMVVLQNSYSASARVISTASQMYDTLLAMVG